MSIETGLYSKLAGTAGVAALVGTRIYPQVVPQEQDLPALAYQRISGAPRYTHSGDAGLTRARFQITCLAATYAGVKALAAVVRAALTGATGAWDDVTVGACLVENEADGWADGFLAPVVRLDCIIWYR